MQANEKKQGHKLLSYYDILKQKIILLLLQVIMPTCDIFNLFSVHTPTRFYTPLLTSDVLILIIFSGCSFPLCFYY
jgi:hypothetical protein